MNKRPRRGTPPETIETTDAERAELAAALEAENDRPRIKAGDLVHGVVASIQDDAVLVSLGGKSDAVMDMTELDQVPDVGATIEAVVISTGAEVRLSARMAEERKRAGELQAAYEAKTPVEGRVIARNKGGYHVAVGPFHGFCPISQIEIGSTPDPEAHVEKTYTFRIIELADNAKRLVLSRAELLKEERSQKAAETRAGLAVGQSLDGHVTSLADYGAFVDIGGIEGLCHVSEISHRRIRHPKDALKVGQAVRVKINKIEEDGRRISLSMKELEDDPWAGLVDRFPAGATFSGKILRKTDFGLFVEVEPGIDGLVHASQLPPGITLGDPSLAPGETVNGWVREVDVDRRRVSLALREVATGDPWADAAERYRSGTVVEGQIERLAPFGAFVLLEPGLTGLIPISELERGNKGGRGGKKTASVDIGQRVPVKVTNIDTERRRISLSIEGAQEEASRSEYRQYLGTNAPAESSGMTAMAEAFERLKRAKG